MTLQQSATFWHDEVLPRIFTNAAFREISRYRLYAEVDSVKVGVVLATKNSRFNNFALNKADFDRLLAAKQSGRIDEAFVVMTATDASGARTYIRSADAEALSATVLANLQPRHGQFGEFWVLPLHPDDEPF